MRLRADTCATVGKGGFDVRRLAIEQILLRISF